MDLDLNSRTAFISGSTQGIGFAVARQLLKEKATVIINGRKPDKVDTAVKQLKQEIPEAQISGIAADLTNKEDTNTLLETLPNIDILINNVGMFEQKEFTDISDADWEAMFELNVLSSVRLSRYFLPKMLGQDWGRIVFISSESAVNVPGDMVHYGATKAALAAMSNGLSKLTKGSGVTVNTIVGGPTYSDGVAETVEQIAETQDMGVDQMKSAIVQQTNPHSLLQRFINPSEIATLAAYLSSPLAAATNGSSLRVDGGTLPTI